MMFFYEAIFSILFPFLKNRNFERLISSWPSLMGNKMGRGGGRHPRSHTQLVLFVLFVTGRKDHGGELN